jgi:hypothetical protein
MFVPILYLFFAHCWMFPMMGLVSCSMFERRGYGPDPRVNLYVWVAQPALTRCIIEYTELLDVLASSVHILKLN